MSERALRGGLIGCGFVSPHHLEGWKRVPGAQLVALCDTDPGRLERASKLAPGAATYRDASAMLDAGPLDFVEICTGPESHVALVVLAACHGAHVLCQKPAANSAGDLDAMISACAASGIRLMIHENWRFRPWYRALRAEIDAGTVGRPTRLRISHHDTRAIRPGGFAEQPYFESMPRLILMDMGCHLIDTSRYLFGEVASVAATLGRFGPGHPGEDVASLALRFEGGAIGLLDISWCTPPERSRPEWALNPTVVEGTEGALRLRLDGALDLARLDGTTERRPVSLPTDDEVYLEGYRATQAHFIEGLRLGTPHETSGEDTRKTMNVVWAAYRSDEEGRRVAP